MKIYIGASRNRVRFKPLAWLIRRYIDRPYNHIYTRYMDPFTKQWIVSESSHGEEHKMGLSKWYLRNKIVEEYEIEVSEDTFRSILIRINNRLQNSYSELNIIGVLFYDLGLKRVAHCFKDGVSSTICSESAAFTLRILGIRFNRPLDFVRPDHIIKKLSGLSRTEEYIRKAD